MARLAIVETVGWVTEFLAAAERRAVRPTTLRLYRDVAEILVRRYPLDLQTCQRNELLAILDAERHRVGIRFYALEVRIIKSGLRLFGREDLAKQVQMPRLPDPGDTIKTLTPEERDKIIREAPTLQDRVIFELLDETGGRRGEISRLKLRDIQFDQYGAIIHLTGKTGTRRRRVYAAVPDLRQLINDHPHKNQSEASLFLARGGKALSGYGFYWRVREYTRQILGHPVHPHAFRHTRATLDSRLFTDRELMMLFGWKRPNMVSVYSHLSLRDVEDKDLALHGLKKREEILRPLTHIQKCRKCQYDNAPIAIYCAKCGELLHGSESEELKQLREKHERLEELVQKIASGEFTPPKIKEHAESRM